MTKTSGRRRASGPERTRVRGWGLPLVFALAACGGNGLPTPSHPDPMALTAENARPIVAALWLGHAVTSTEDIVSAQLRDLLYDYLPLLAFRPNELPLEIGCGQSGAVTVSGVVADSARPGESVGDQATAVFRACEESYDSLFSETASGSLSVEVTGGDADERAVVARFDELAVEIADSGPLVENGALNLTLSVDSSTTSLASEWFTVSSGPLTRLVTDYHLRLRVPKEGEYLLEFGGTQSGGELTGAVSFETTTPFGGTLEGYPRAGRLELEGANGSKVVLEARADGETVALTINGASPIELSWIELEE